MVESFKVVCSSSSGRIAESYSEILVLLSSSFANKFELIFRRLQINLN